jgi:hypothetical protein
MQLTTCNLLRAVSILAMACWTSHLAPTNGAVAQDKEQPAITIKTIIGKWKERERRTETFDFVWDSEHCEIFQTARLSKRDRLNGQSMPDDIFPRHRRFLSDNRGWTRFEEEGREWDSEKKLYVPKQTINVFQGDAETTFFAHSAHEFPTAHSDTVTINQVDKDVRTWPIRMAFRPFSSHLGAFDLDTLVLADDKAMIQQRPVLVLKFGNSTVWIDPAEDFMPVQRTDKVKGVVRREVEISYKRDETYGWVPTTWKIDLLDPQNNITWIDSATVTSYSINKAIPDADFKLTLPVGTLVHDYEKDQIYVLDAAGAKRPDLASGYDGNKYRQLLESEAKKSEGGDDKK